MFTDSTTKVDSEPPNGSNEDITNPYECDQTLNLVHDSNVEYLRANLNIKGMSNSKATSLSNVDYPSLLKTLQIGKGSFLRRSPEVAEETYLITIHLTEAEEEAVAREVHATHARIVIQTRAHDDELTLKLKRSVAREVQPTHARIVSGPDPEPMQEDQTGSNSRKLHVSLAGPNPEHMDDEFLVTAYPKVHENLKLITDERVIEENPENDQEKSKVIEESDFPPTIPDQASTVTSTPPVIAPFTDVSSTKPSSLVTPSPINTEATTITTSLPKITPFIALQLRVARLEQEMSEVKKTDHSCMFFASSNPNLRYNREILCRAGPESIKNQASEKSPNEISESKEQCEEKEIIRAKKEQGEEKQDSTYSIRSTDKVDLEEFDLKSALFKHMNKIKSANRNTANYHLYHALMEDLIADEDAMDKEVADKVKDHKRKHDSDDDEDDDDDEGPSTGSNQGRSTKRRRSEYAASGSAQPPSKDDVQCSKKPRESDASASKQHPALTSSGWQITDTRDASADSSMHRSDPESEHSEQSSDDIPMQDEGNDSDMEDTDNAHIPKVSTTTWFKPIPESERPATPEPEWTIPPNDFPEPEINWANTYATTYQVPAENKLQRKTYDIGSFIKWFCRRTGKKKLCKADLEGPAFNLVKAFHKNNVFLQYQMDECHKLLTNKDTYPILLSFTHCGNKSILRVLRIILVILPEHPSETMVFHNEDGNPARANIKQALGYLKDGDGDGNSQYLRCHAKYRMPRTQNFEHNSYRLKNN
ncbi:hypothetical protein Tco_0505692 [Tanacetum coccineum]